MKFTSLLSQLFLGLLVSAASETYTLAFGGDVMLGRKVAENIEAIDKGKPGRFVQGISNIFRSADISFVNLESPFLFENLNHKSRMKFRADPAQASILTELGVDVVSIANNHFYDNGVQGIIDSIKILEQKKIKVSGISVTNRSEQLPIVFQSEKLSVAFLSYTLWINDYSPIQTDPIKKLSIPIMVNDIQRAKEKYNLVIVSIHTGAEYVQKAGKKQITIAKSAIDAGADLIIGHHSHWVGQVKRYKDKFIVYSLGNLIFDQNWQEQTQKGLIVVAHVSQQKITHLTLHPTISENTRPRMATKTEAVAFLKEWKLRDKYISEFSKSIMAKQQIVTLDLVFGGNFIISNHTLRRQVFEKASVFRSLQSGDLTFINCELNKQNVDTQMIKNTFSMFSKLGVDVFPFPPHQCTQKRPLDIMQQWAGIQDKIKNLTLQNCGIRINDTEAYRPITFTIKQITVSYICFTDQNPNSVQGQIPKVAKHEIVQIKNAVINAKRNNNSSFIIFGIHALDNFNYLPLAKISINAGTNIVIRYHPSNVQPILKYRQGYIIQSLGSLFSPSEQQQGVILKANIQFIDGRFKELKFLPIPIGSSNSDIPTLLKGLQGDNLVQILDIDLHGNASQKVDL